MQACIAYFFVLKRKFWIHISGFWYLIWLGYAWSGTWGPKIQTKMSIAGTSMALPFLTFYVMLLTFFPKVFFCPRFSGVVGLPYPHCWPHLQDVHSSLQFWKSKFSQMPFWNDKHLAESELYWSQTQNSTGLTCLPLLPFTFPAVCNKKTTVLGNK